MVRIAIPRRIWSTTAFASTCCACGSAGAGAGGTTGAASCTIGIANDSPGWAVLDAAEPDDPEIAAVSAGAVDGASPPRPFAEAGPSARASALAKAWTNASTRPGFRAGPAGGVVTTPGGAVTPCEAPRIGAATGVGR